MSAAGRRHTRILFLQGRGHQGTHPHGSVVQLCPGPPLFSIHCTALFTDAVLFAAITCVRRNTRALRPANKRISPTHVQREAIHLPLPGLNEVLEVAALRCGLGQAVVLFAPALRRADEQHSCGAGAGTGAGGSRLRCGVLGCGVAWHAWVVCSAALHVVCAEEIYADMVVLLCRGDLCRHGGAWK